MEESWNCAALSPSSTGAITPFWTNFPIQSWGPTIKSGPWPVGTWVMKSSRTAAKSLTTSFTSMPVSDLNFSVMSFRAGERSASTHMVMAPAPAALRSGFVASELGAVEALPPQAVSARAAATEIAPAAKTRRVV
ncbi:hypothetical protein D3C73_1077150 [compost metagenome]